MKKLYKFSDFLTPSEVRLKPKESEKLKLSRIEKINFDGEIFLSDKASNTDMIIIEPGDLVISGINVEKGALAVYRGSEKILATIHYSSYAFNKSLIDPEYLKLFFKSPQFHTLIAKATNGGIKTEIKPKHFLPLEIYLPDLTEQHSIVQKTNTLLGYVQTLVKSQEENHLSVDSLKKLILQDAIQGKLVPQDPNDVPVEKLLEKIKAEKEKLIKEKKIKKEKSSLPISKEEIPFDLPKGWGWVRLNEIAFVTKLAGFEYSKYIKLKDSGEIPVIRAQNVKNNVIKKDNLRYIDSNTSLILERSALTKKSILMTFIGAGIGDIALFNEKERWHLAPNVAKIEFHLPEITEYALWFLNSPAGKKEIFKHLKTTAQPSLSMQTIRNIFIPISSLNGQRRIVEKIWQLIKICDEQKKNISEAKSNIEKLNQAILREVFA